MLAVSAHFGDEDAARVRAVLNRGLDEESISHLLSFQMGRWDEPGWVPGNEELGLEARLFAPIRCHGLLLGYLVLIDPDRNLDEATVQGAAIAADEAGLVLYRRLVMNEREQNKAEAVLRDLLSADESARERAVQEVADDGLLVPAERTLIVVSRLRDVVVARGGASGAMSAAVERITRTEPSGTTLSMTQGRQTVVLRVGGNDVSVQLGRSLGQRILSNVCHELGMSDSCTVGVSNVSSGLHSLRGPYEEARGAAQAAALLPKLCSVSAWEELGVYALLMKLSSAELTPQAYSPAIARLIEQGVSGDLSHTAEVFLDCAGDSRRAAAELHIHRSTLYHRLARIEQITDMSLRNGSDRLVLHLGLKLARLVDAHRSSAAS